MLSRSALFLPSAALTPGPSPTALAEAPIAQHCSQHSPGVWPFGLPLAWADPHRLATLLPARGGCEGDRMTERAGLGLRITLALLTPTRPHG